jgi:L-amino acid N-acyltransferase YncA
MIRSAREDDFGSIAAITNHYITTTAIHFGYEPVSPDSLLSLWRASCDRFPWLVTTEDDAVIGYAKGGTWRDRAAYAWTVEVGLYVAPDRHRRGRGRALYSALLEELAQRGFRSAIAGITMPNDPSIAFHLALGFVSVGTVRDAGYKHGQWHDVAFMQKRFATGPTEPVA